MTTISMTRPVLSDPSANARRAPGRRVSLNLEGAPSARDSVHRRRNFFLMSRHSCLPGGSRVAPSRVGRIRGGGQSSLPRARLLVRDGRGSQAPFPSRLEKCSWVSNRCQHSCLTFSDFSVGVVGSFSPSRSMSPTLMPPAWSYFSHRVARYRRSRRRSPGGSRSCLLPAVRPLPTGRGSARPLRFD